MIPLISDLISGFLKSEKLKKFSALENREEKIKFIFEHEAYWPLQQVQFNFFVYYLFVLIETSIFFNK